MALKKYNKTNFHKHTFCEFIEVDTAAIPNIEWHYKSKSGSGYCFTEEGVYRISNHWGRAANCRWRLISNSSSKINNSQNRIGYAKWTDFNPNNETEKLFYVEVNFETKEATFQHKNNPNYDGKAVLRNASETAKVIRQIKEILESDTWAKYLNYDDLEQFRKEIISKLIQTSTSFAEIKRSLL
ncbi:hypothetical protein B0I03_11042 [Flavobacterium aquaticum]|uniref:Uncharacterized protein n=1 Tax=Flavobacterium aquaticum TaxID=1236486 RepID=A0A327YIN1_9FLAO|nr:hypothetical protein [Flavobacterium aquaticum]RAK19615.1 hypothetical protein B0I03_11042 [Flavobacterium aquaticum]